jgi:hypothetical protein
VRVAPNACPRGACPLSSPCLNYYNLSPHVRAHVLCLFHCIAAACPSAREWHEEVPNCAAMAKSVLVKAAKVCGAEGESLSPAFASCREKSSKKRLAVHELRQVRLSRLKGYFGVCNDAPQDKKCDISQNLLDLQRIRKIRTQEIVSEGSLMFNSSQHRHNHEHISHKV